MTLSSTTIDKTAIGLSVACAIHCLVLPIALATLPALGGTVLGDERFHQYLLYAVVPTSIIALFLGCRQHRRLHVLFLGIAGLCVLTAAVIFGHDVLGEMGEKMASLFGGALIAISHWNNYRLCRQQRCEN